MKLKIPRKLFQDGIDLCKRNVQNYLEEAKIIARKGFLHHAYVSVQLAMEETGKIIWLNEELKNSSTDPVDVPNAIFGKDGGRSHREKFKKAKKELNPDVLWVCAGDFHPEDFSSKDFYVGEEASPRVRLENAYVNFCEKNQKWYIGCNIDKSRLIALIRNVEQAVSSL